MKRFLLPILLLFSHLFSSAQDEKWFPFQLDSNVTISFPDFPTEKDTLNQKIFSVFVQQDLMLAIKIEVPSDTTTDSIIWKKWMQEYILQNTEGTKIILEETANFHGFPAIYYKFKSFQGLQNNIVAENYLIKAHQKLYHFAYWRFQPQNIANEIQSKRFFDNVSIVPEILSDSVAADYTLPPDTFKKSNKSIYIGLIVALIIILGLITLWVIQRRKKRYSSSELPPNNSVTH